MAAKPVDTDNSILVSLADHAQKILQEFVDLGRDDKSRGVELLAELDHVVAEFRRLRPPPTFRTPKHLSLVRTSGEETPLCIICGKEVDRLSSSFFETPGAAYHLTCYGRAIGSV